MEIKSKVTIYTDGACSGNPGRGGWAAVLIYDDNNQKYLSGSEPMTTNNKMELKAIIEALLALENPHTINLYTDSLYVKNGITEWIKKWKLNNWRTINKQPVKNMDLWTELDTLSAKHDISWHWVKAHNGNVYNEKVDKLARESLKNI